MKFRRIPFYHSPGSPVIKFALFFLLLLILVAASSLIYVHNQKQSLTDIMKIRTISIVVDGRSFFVKTHLNTIKEVLDSNKIFIGPNDIVQPDPNQQIDDRMRIIVNRLSKSEKEYTIDTPFPTVYYEDKNIDEGKRVVIQNGKPGVQKVLVYQKSINGEIETTLRKTGKTITPYVSEVIAIGKKPVQIQAIDKYKQALPIVDSPSEAEVDERPTNRVSHIDTDINAVSGKYTIYTIQAELTAYTAGVESTGKQPGDKGYGVTFSGAQVKDEQTISVDPTIIPLNWWVYIEGIGYRKAEDTGSAIKGNRIDVFMSNLNDAKNFGRKNSVTVHVIGPDKPE